MKKSLLIVALVMFASTIFAASSQSSAIQLSDAISVTSSDVVPGKKLTLKERVILKRAKKALKQGIKPNEEAISKGLYILLALIGWGFLGIGLMSDWEGSEWIICLVLTVLFYIPGLIYALIKMKNYY
ncbi:MAG: uncharacterized membrane protein YqaE (UPF0057 family) [Saprospiraceae bacterium]|jgi:uncharacterized membrane protein YqaE (UPF0057 family)